MQSDCNVNKKRICIIGLGYIGLPTACILVDQGYYVHGIDSNRQVISEIKSGLLKSLEPRLPGLFEAALASNNFILSTEIISAEIYIIIVPTPLTSDNQPNLSSLNLAISSIGPHLKVNDLVLIESTCPIGTTERIAANLRNFCSKVFVAYCPERALPGNIIYELENNDRIVGGVDQASTTKAAEFYRSFVKGEILTVSSARIAEATKLAENSYRDVNIAFANELSMIADHFDIDVCEVIDAANKHPRVQIARPGIGVGGYCIPVNPWFLISSTPDLCGLTLKARNVNLTKTDWVIKKIKETVYENKINSIACLGMTYKPDVSDSRNSVALELIQRMRQEIEEIVIFESDLYVENAEEYEIAIGKADMIIILVAHQEFTNISPVLLKDKIILDFVGVTSKFVQ